MAQGKSDTPDGPPAESMLKFRARLREGNRVTIPAAVRERLGLDVGDRLKLLVRRDPETVEVIDIADPAAIEAEVAASAEVRE